MKPLPIPEQTKETSKPMPILPLNPDPSSYSTANRRTTSSMVQRLYPWLLFASTGVAAFFCFAYITKPVVVAAPSLSPAEQGAGNLAIHEPAKDDTLPNTPPPDEDGFPGDGGLVPDNNIPSALVTSDFEETNIRIQHVIDAESPSGDVRRLTIDVPVLYRSRMLRWSHSEAEQARNLLARLSAYQEQVRSLRTEGTELLDAWNALMDSSIPTQALRADSPSLPGNQRHPFSSATNNASDTIETIKLQKADK